MTCAQGLLRLLWGGGRSWSATGLIIGADFKYETRFFLSRLISEKTQTATLCTGIFV